MLFMIVAKHTAEMCPGGLLNPDRKFIAKIDAQMKKSGARLQEGYSDAPGHTFYFVVETDSNEALNDAVEPLRLVGDVDIVPVLKFSEALAWSKRMGIQE